MIDRRRDRIKKKFMNSGRPYDPNRDREFFLYSMYLHLYKMDNTSDVIGTVDLILS